MVHGSTGREKVTLQWADTEKRGAREWRGRTDSTGIKEGGVAIRGVSLVLENRRDCASRQYTSQRLEEKEEETGEP